MEEKYSYFSLNVPLAEYVHLHVSPTNSHSHTYKDLDEKRNGLDSLSKTHLVCEDAVLACVPVEEEPVDPLQLVGSQEVVIFVLSVLLQMLEGGGRWTSDKLCVKREWEGVGRRREGGRKKQRKEEWKGDRRREEKRRVR